MPKAHKCQARQYIDQMICVPCGLIWDINDPDPPECRKKIKPPKIKIDAAPLKYTFPTELPNDLAGEMVKAFHAQNGGSLGMRAAYRLFLDRIEP